MTDTSDRARARSARFRKMAFSVNLREDSPTLKPLYQALKARKLDRNERKKMREIVKRGSAIAAAQRANGAGFHIDTYLRHFLQEYNGRIMSGEGVNLPSSFNIIRSMIEPDEHALILKLLPENINVLSFAKMLDQITDPSVDTNLSVSCGNLEELIIYEINMLGGHANFRIPGNEDHIFCGVAFCREGEELSLMGVFGRPISEPDAKIMKVDPDDLYPGKEFLLKIGDEVDVSDEYLLGDRHFAPLILMARVDLKRGTVHVRHAMKETKDTFTVISDDPEHIEFLVAKRGSDPALIKNYLAQLDAYGSLFEILFSAPSCLPLMETDDVVLERHPTSLRLKPKGRDAKLAASLPVFEAPRFVTVRTMFDLGSVSPSYSIPPSNLKMETSGYWKTLQMGEEGRDKGGQPVQGKTWVTTTSSWSEARTLSDGLFKLKSDIEPRGDPDDVGSLYVMRNASHPLHVYKVGYTRKDAEHRASQLGSSTGQPDVFNIVQIWEVKSPQIIEHEVHELLKAYRINDRREFFQLRYDKLREVIEKVLERTGALDG